MPGLSLVQQELTPEVRDFYSTAIALLNQHQVEFLVGGAYALTHYTGIVRHTKDFDIFVRPTEVGAVLDLLADFGHRTELTFPHWLGKAYQGESFIDVIYSSGNGVATVDEAWFQYADEGVIWDQPVRLCPAEEIIWSKAFLMERERFDGADIAHFIRAYGHRMDWSRLLDRFGKHWRVLMSHLTIYGFIYPGERDKVPEWVMLELIERLNREVSALSVASPVCQGTLISREQYLVDVREWGYDDARQYPRGRMTADEIDHWTSAIGRVK